MVKTIKNILCPVDLFDFHPRAAKHALRLSEAFDAKIIILYVFQPLSACRDGCGVSFTPKAVGAALRRKAEAKTAEIISEFFNSELVKGEIVFGQAAEQIIRKAEEYSSDMIVMASHGRSALGRAIHGSVTNKVLANTKIPVLVVHPQQQ